MTDITTLQKAYLMIQKLKKKLQEQEARLPEPVAIIGMSCRLPEVNSLDAFWSLLCGGQQVISPMPEARWRLLKDTDEWRTRDPERAYWGGYLNHIDAFDAYFFGISPREAVRMDPQQRLLLEVCYESFEDAGLTVETLAGSNTGMFTSLYASQFGHLQVLEDEMDALFLPTGSAVSIAANRLSYLFDLRGPSMALDTACSSSLIAIQLACLNIQAKICDQAVVSAVNINLLPSVHEVLAKASMLSPSGRCKTFDAAADGYVQGEGACAIVLKPLSQAIKDNDRIYAVIAGSAVNQDGKTNGLTAPNGLQQEALLKSAYRSANVNPAELSYIECHGTGTFLGDPIEVQALGEVVGRQRTEDNPCWIGSVKTNVGHLEPAAGLVAVIKTALVLKHATIPPHLHLQTPNPHIPFQKYHFKIPQSVETLPRHGEAAFAGVSGFGFGGANAHIVLRSYDSKEQVIQQDKKSPELFTISAKDSYALMDMMSIWEEFLIQHPETDLHQLCYNLHLRRSHYTHRLAIIADSIADLVHQLSQLQDDVEAKLPQVFIQLQGKQSKGAIRIDDVAYSDLKALARAYVNHASIDWKKYEQNRHFQYLDMPLYPWQHKIYWPTLGRQHRYQDNSQYPMRGTWRASPLPQQQFEFVFDTKALPEIKDTYYVLHAGFYMEMLAFAMQQMNETTGFQIQDLMFMSPLVVPEGRTVVVQLIVDRVENGSASFAFYSDDGKHHWIQHAKGAIVQQHEPDGCPVMDKKSTVQGTTVDFYERILGMGMPAGDTIQWTQTYHVHDQTIYCELRMPKPVERSDQFVLSTHPGIIDACIQTVFLLLPRTINKPYVASRMGRVTFYKKPNGPMRIYSRLKAVQDDGKQLVADWYLLNEQDEVMASCIDLTMTQLSDSINIESMMNIESTFQLDKTQSIETQRSQVIHYLTQQIAAIFAMPACDVGLHQSLYDLGMDSLMAMAVIRMIEANLGISYALPQLMQHATISAITDAVLMDNQAIIQPKADEGHSSWIYNRKPNPQAKIRLFCFPFGGGGASIYREWQAECPDFIEICPIQLPGRENRMSETPIDQMETLVSLLAADLKPLMDKPFAFFGHSFGSLIAFELTRFLRHHHLPQPIHLFPSAYPDPRVPSKSLDKLLLQLKQMDLHLFDLDKTAIGELSDQQLQQLSIIFKENGVVDYSDTRMNQSIVQVLLPIFIGDMSIVKRYHYREEPLLNQAITVFVGQQDTWVSPEDHAGWAQQTSSTCEFQHLDSGHLFIKDAEIRKSVIQVISNNLETALLDA